MRFAPLAIALLCLLAYAPCLSMPLFEDDYGNLIQAQVYGPAAGLPQLMHDAVFRLRATSYWAMWLLWRTFQLTPWGYHLASLILHAANAWLVYSLAASWRSTRPAAFWAGAFFAVAEGHQEAVIWFSAINELLLFFFGAASLLCWVRADRARRPWLLRLASVALFALALLSKESAVILLPLFLLACAAPRWRAALRLAPHMALAGLAIASLLASRGSSFRFSDGSFSLAAPFWITWPRSIARLLWVWGWLSLATLAVLRARDVGKPALAGGTACPTDGAAKPVCLSLAWTGLALLPYSFLTYSTQIPSRQTYLASAGLAFLAGLALARLSMWKPSGPRLAAAAAAVALLANVGYLWTRKRSQFLERAEPTEQLIALARRTTGPIWVRCFPRNNYIAQTAVQLGAGRSPSILVWSEAEAARLGATEFCYRER
ncbi:MAG: glycosyltransferase family 39 protein [Bryobacteraceae bacterium]|jgi:hypothetical protein